METKGVESHQAAAAPVGGCAGIGVVGSIEDTDRAPAGRAGNPGAPRPAVEGEENLLVCDFKSGQPCAGPLRVFIAVAGQDEPLRGWEVGDGTHRV